MSMNILITGGCGFIGCNAAMRFAAAGHRVTVFDDLSRPGASLNLEWLWGQGDIAFLRGDVCDPDVVKELIAEGGFDAIIHLAAQVAVTTSVADPRRDFEVNALGTLNILESVRHDSPRTIVLYASTNKVFGKLAAGRLHEGPRRYSLVDYPEGIGEGQPLDFCSPYGCSKGAAEQYVLDYARIYGLRTVSFRQSCIYGPRQFGLEDQGWVAWFLIAQLLVNPL